jgi:hypothetical protein
MYYIVSGSDVILDDVRHNIYLTHIRCLRRLGADYVNGLFR